VLINNSDNHAQGVYAASWIVLGNPSGFYGRQKMEEAGAMVPGASGLRLWTDTYSSLFGILK
jgi:hypothetical protein